MRQFSDQAFATLKWHCYRFFDQVGLLGRGALLAILLAIGLFFMQWTALQQQFNRAHDLAVSLTPKENTTINQAKMLAEYTAQFPKLRDKAVIFNSLMQLANVHALTLDAVTYKTKPSESMAPFSQTTVDFTLNAPYPQVHDFINKMMVDMPFVTIEQWRISRSSNEDEAIEAHIRLLFNFVLE